jgi:WD40 repeat protein
MINKQWRRWAMSALLLSSTLSLGGCLTLEFSPDGKRIAYLWANGPEDNTIAISNTDGTGLMAVPGKDFMNGHWSPEGHRLAYSDQQGIRIFDIRTRKVSSRIIGDNAEDCVWSTDGSKIIGLVQKDRDYKLHVFDLNANKMVQEIDLDGGGTQLMHVPFLDAVTFLGADGNLHLAEFGTDTKLTTTGDVIGYRLLPSKKSLIFARKTANPQFILLSLYEYDLQLRSVKKLNFPAHVAGINPKPRTGPSNISAATFSADGKSMLLIGEERVKDLSLQRLYLVRSDGTGGKLLGGAKGSRDGVMGAFGPDGSVAIWSQIGNTLKLEIMNSNGQRRTLRQAILPTPK